MKILEYSGHCKLELTSAITKYTQPLFYFYPEQVQWDLSADQAPQLWLSRYLQTVQQDSPKACIQVFTHQNSTLKEESLEGRNSTKVEDGQAGDAIVGQVKNL